MTPSQAFKEHPFSLIASFIIIIGALNWLTIGFVGYDFVADWFGKYRNYVYCLVGLAGLYVLARKIVWLTN